MCALLHESRKAKTLTVLLLLLLSRVLQHSKAGRACQCGPRTWQRREMGIHSESRKAGGERAEQATERTRSVLTVEWCGWVSPVRKRGTWPESARPFSARFRHFLPFSGGGGPSASSLRVCTTNGDGTRERRWQRTIILTSTQHAPLPHYYLVQCPPAAAAPPSLPSCSSPPLIALLLDVAEW